MPLSAVEPQRLYRQIADQLRQLMDGGEFPVGSRLPTERELAEKLGVSRPTVREALIALEVEGRLKIRVGSGIYVIARRPVRALAARAPIEGPFEVLRARAFVESAIAEEAARHVDDEDIARLDAVLAEVEQQPIAHKLWVGIDRSFHVAIAAILDNAVLLRTVGELFDQRINPYFNRLSRHVWNASMWKAAHAEHVAIRDAIAARDPAAARAAMHDHLKQSHRRFAKDLGKPRSQADTEARQARSRLTA